MKHATKPAPAVVAVAWCTVCGEAFLADKVGTKLKTSCPYCPVNVGRVRWRVYSCRSEGEYLASKRLEAMRAALKKLAGLELIDPGDAQDILDEDDRRRRGAVSERGSRLRSRRSRDETHT